MYTSVIYIVFGLIVIFTIYSILKADQRGLDGELLKTSKLKKENFLALFLFLLLFAIMMTFTLSFKEYCPGILNYHNINFPYQIETGKNNE
jgi:hypothetical protein